MDLQDAHGAGLLRHRHPFGGGELLVHALELERVRAIGSLQRTAMGELGEQPHGSAGAQSRRRAAHTGGRLVVDDQRLEMSVRLGGAHAFIYPLSASPCSSSSTSLLMTWTGAA